MRREMRSSLQDLDQLSRPALAEGTTVGIYVEVLREAAGARRNDGVGLRLFERWARARFGGREPFPMCEFLLEQFREELRDGKIRRRGGKKYHHMAREAPARVFHLHNLAAEHSPVILRPLLNPLKVRKLRRFARLSPTTHKALAWFEREGLRTPPAGGNGRQVMSEATRTGSTRSALKLLDLTSKKGLELVTEVDIARITPPADAADPTYRRVARMLHAVSAVYRACVREGLLACNPLANVDNRIFAAYAERNFLPPSEVARIRDLATVDLEDSRQVTDRLVTLLFLDLAVRRNELAAVDLDDLRRTPDGHFQIILAPEAQKMAGKPRAVLDVLYPETERLISIYLDTVRSNGRPGRLILDPSGNGASGQALAAAVAREARRLRLKCYYNDKPPSPHDLRRTFASCNAAPLGLGLNPHEIAERLRASIEVVYRHYVLENPLLREERANRYRARLENSEGQLIKNHDTAAPHPGAGNRRPNPTEPISSPVQEPEALGGERQHSPESPPREWVGEEEAMALIGGAWQHMPSVRTLRAFLTERGALRRMGAHGHVHYDVVHIKELVGAYDPIEDYAGPGALRSRQLRRLLGDCTLVRVGNVHLIGQHDLRRLLKDIRVEPGCGMVGIPSLPGGQGSEPSQSVEAGSPDAEDVA